MTKKNSPSSSKNPLIHEQKSKRITSDSLKKKIAGTQIIDDIFTDMVGVVKPKFEVDFKAYVNRLWEANPDIYKTLKSSVSIEDARDKLYTYLDKVERAVLLVNVDIHVLEKATVRECVKVFKSIIGPINEYRTGFSAMEYLWKLAVGKEKELSINVSVAFLQEFINMFRGVAGKSNIYYEHSEAKKGLPDFFQLEGQKAANARTDILDDLGGAMYKYFKKYPSGLDKDVVNWRKTNKNKILKYFNATEADWNNHVWHMKNVIKDEKPLLDLIQLSAEQKKAVAKATKYKIPFGITPYYLSLIDPNPSIGYDHPVRAQVIPPPEYVDIMVENRKNRCQAFDFMGEHDTSPVNLVTRRYPCIAILKPYHTCPQICVYCQRNWEIDQVLAPNAMASKKDIDNAIDWLDDHKNVGDILVTGGDPAIMTDVSIDDLFGKLSEKEHIYRIRLGTRTLVTLPMRWTDKLVETISKYHQPPKREIAIVTHFEQSYEITPDVLQAVQKIRKAGISVYNQIVFTIENSSRFETSKLRRDLKSVGIDPLYTFNMKGKDETRRYIVPIARILQERKEEARLLPGLDRTDEPVFNVPRLGKNYLQAWQDHRIIMILPDGSRVFEFHGWEKNIRPVPPYIYTDVPIYDYLEELAARGENIRDYRTIWYYY